uniref:Putative secreted protein n=1 Tax=Panstrongylus lignarius TaxID=156445 RepID=A0A224XQU8_9HEMI
MSSFMDLTLFILSKLLLLQISVLLLFSLPGDLLSFSNKSPSGLFKGNSCLKEVNPRLRNGVEFSDTLLLVKFAGRLGDSIEFLFSDRICPEINEPKPDGNLAFSSSVFNGEDDNISKNPSSVDEQELSDEKDENCRLLLGDSILFNLFGGNPHGSANRKLEIESASERAQPLSCELGS